MTDELLFPAYGAGFEVLVSLLSSQCLKCSEFQQGKAKSVVRPH